MSQHGYIAMLRPLVRVSLMTWLLRRMLVYNSVTYYVLVAGLIAYPNCICDVVLYCRLCLPRPTDSFTCGAAAGHLDSHSMSAFLKDLQLGLDETGQPWDGYACDTVLNTISMMCAI